MFTYYQVENICKQSKSYKLHFRSELSTPSLYLPCIIGLNLEMPPFKFEVNPTLRPRMTLSCCCFLISINIFVLERHDN